MPGGWKATHPDWSPDGTRLSSSSTTPVWVAALDGTAAHKEAASRTGHPCLALDYPAWSPDGLKLAYTRYDGPPLAGGPPTSSAIEIVDVATGKRSVVTQTERLELVNRRAGPPTADPSSSRSSGSPRAERRPARQSLSSTPPGGHGESDHGLLALRHLPGLEPEGREHHLHHPRRGPHCESSPAVLGELGWIQADPDRLRRLDGSAVGAAVVDAGRLAGDLRPDGEPKPRDRQPGRFGLARLDGFPATHPRLRPIP